MNGSLWQCLSKHWICLCKPACPGLLPLRPQSLNAKDMYLTMVLLLHCFFRLTMRCVLRSSLFRCFQEIHGLYRIAIQEASNNRLQDSTIMKQAVLTLRKHKLPPKAISQFAITEKVVLFSTLSMTSMGSKSRNRIPNDRKSHCVLNKYIAIPCSPMEAMAAPKSQVRRLSPCGSIVKLPICFHLMGLICFFDCTITKERIQSLYLYPIE